MQNSVLHLPLLKISILFDQSSNWPRQTLGPVSLKIISIAKKALSLPMSKAINIPLAFIYRIIKEPHGVLKYQIPFIILGIALKLPKPLNVINNILCIVKLLKPIRGLFWLYLCSFALDNKIPLDVLLDISYLTVQFGYQTGPNQ